MEQKNKNQDTEYRKSDFDPNWIINGFTPETVAFAEKFGLYLATGNGRISNTQVRNIFGEVKSIQSRGIEKNLNDFLLLKPKLAYTVGRFRKESVKIGDFREVMDMACDAVGVHNGKANEEHFQRFVDFMEAVLSYHRFSAS